MVPQNRQTLFLAKSRSKKTIYWRFVAVDMVSNASIIIIIFWNLLPEILLVGAPDFENHLPNTYTHTYASSSIDATRHPQKTKGEEEEEEEE